MPDECTPVRPGGCASQEPSGCGAGESLLRGQGETGSGKRSRPGPAAGGEPHSRSQTLLLSRQDWCRKGRKAAQPCNVCFCKDNQGSGKQLAFSSRAVPSVSVVTETQ